MKKVIIYVFLLFYTLNICFSNNNSEKKYLSDFFQLDTVLTLNNIYSDDDFSFTYCNNILYFSTSPTLKNFSQFHLVTYDYVKRSTGEIVLELPDTLRNIYIRDIEVTNKYIFLLDWKKILMFDKKSLKYKKNIIISRPYKYIKYLNRKLYFIESGIYSSNKNAKTYTHIGIYNFETNQIKNYDLSDPQSYQFSFFGPSKYVALGKYFFIIADIDTYKIRVYNYELKKINDIVYNHSEWINIGKQFYEHIKPSKNKKYFPKKIIDSLRPFFYKNSLIHQVDFVNDSILLIKWSLPLSNMKKEYYYDIWKYNFRMNKFKPLFLKLKQRIPKKNDKFLDLKILPINGLYIVKENFLIDIQPIPFSIYQDKTYNELFKQINNYYLDNNISYSIVIRRLKL